MDMYHRVECLCEGVSRRFKEHWTRNSPEMPDLFGRETFLASCGARGLANERRLYPGQGVGPYGPGGKVPANSLA